MNFFWENAVKCLNNLMCLTKGSLFSFRIAMHIYIKRVKNCLSLQHSGLTNVIYVIGDSVSQTFPQMKRNKRYNVTYAKF